VVPPPSSNRAAASRPDFLAAALGALSGFVTLVLLVFYPFSPSPERETTGHLEGPAILGLALAVAFAVTFLVMGLRVLRKGRWKAALSVVALVGTTAAAYGSWLLVHGRWIAHATASSPDGLWLAESRNFYVWAPIYGWSHYHLRVSPSARIRCKEPHSRWRGTPDDITSWKFEHQYATYNDFDGSARFPTGLHWLSSSEFVVDGGEGGGSVFEVEPQH
jgi:hypothetical protein